MPENLELSSEDCQRLLRSGTVGRVAVSTPRGPHIVPVNYVVSGDSVIFRTSPYSVLGSHARNSLLAFEIDHIEPARELILTALENGASVVTANKALLAEDGPTLFEAAE